MPETSLYRAFKQESAIQCSYFCMLVQGDLERFKHLNQHIKLLLSAGFQHCLNTIIRRLPTEARRIIDKRIDLDSQAIGNLDNNWKAQLRVPSFDMAHMRCRYTRNIS